MTEKLLIIDGSSLLSTSFYATATAYLMAKTDEDKEKALERLMKTSDGRYTNGVFPFMRTLLSLIKKNQPTHLAVVWDVSRQTFRQEIAGGTYKGTRKATPHPLKEQFISTQNLLQGIIPQFLSGRDDEEVYEADDFAGSLAKRFQTEIPVFLHTKDEDYLQLVDSNTRVWLGSSKADKMFEDLNLNRQEFNVPDGFFEFTLSTLKDIKGLEPYQIVEYKALCGDTSDNIPGVKGVGEKAVIPLLQEYGTIEAIYETIENLSAKEEKELKKFFKESLGIGRSPISYMLADGVIALGNGDKINYNAIFDEVTEEDTTLQPLFEEKLGKLKFPIRLSNAEDIEKLKNEEVFGVQLCAKESAFMSKELATIKTDIESIAQVNLDDIKLNIDYTELKNRLLDLEIKTLI
ncbi:MULTISPECIES: 5'-3' exonuclease H3TH domain-containing protein [unclassified Clostridium]|uniref:5'-3' exonuclease n=1 Tax=unclassified Clostridium TaxID=2614128 RepID=UPI000340EFDF|nr:MULTISPECIES: 5'-3' exonuclease H3TH domain-containing protein [unclassified Clostridium]MEE0568277.1 5'-3' exonuclease H3TH domain-containing protein [Clostridium sp.]CDB75925.1 dNA polymerase I [Clostridium sp. CAG:265]